MSGTTRITALRYVMIATGAIFLFGLYPLMRLWPSGWSWGVGHSHYPMMIVGVYGTLGLFLIIGARDPLANRSLIWFTVVSSVIHSLVMAVEAFTDPAEMGHLLGDVPALLLVALALAALTPSAAAVATFTERPVRRAA